MQQNRRRTYLINNKLQFGLAKRLVMYWCITWLLVFILPICVRIWFKQVPFDQLATQLIADFWFPIVLSLMFLPIVAWDSIRFSNRIAGPVFRTERMAERLNAGEKVEALAIRKTDFCQKLISEFNILVTNHSDCQPKQSQSKSEEDQLQNV